MEGLNDGASADKAPVWVPIESAVKADWNYKEDDPEKQEKLVANIKRNGQIETTIVRPLPTGFYEVVNGNHRYDAFVTCGMKGFWAFNIGEVSLAHAQRVAIETNETRFTTNDVRLAKLMQEIEMEFSREELEATMPFDKARLDAMAEMLEFQGFGGEENGANSGGEGNKGEGLKSIHLIVPESVYETWQRWVEKCEGLFEYHSPAIAFEVALVGAMNLPDEELTGNTTHKEKV